MKRKIIAALLVLLCLSGCAGGDDPYRVDTVVYIPADTVEAATEQVQTETAEPQAVREMTESVQTEPELTEPEQETTATEPEATEAAKQTTSSGKKPASSKKPSSNKNNGSKEEKATEPPATEPVATEPPVNRPAETEPAPTQPVQMEPAKPEPVPTETAPAEHEPTELPVTEPPATEPPVTEPPATEPPATEPPTTEPEPTDPPLYDISGYSVGSLEYAMRDVINAYRADAGLGELKLSSRLSAIASCRGYEISRVWSHTRPDGRGYQTVLNDYGYGGSARELLVYVSGSGDGQSIVDKWKASDSHKDLLLGSFSTVGIGVYRENGMTYIACLLAG